MGLREKYARYVVVLENHEGYKALLRTSMSLLNELTNLQMLHLRSFGIDLGDTPVANELLNQLRRHDPLYRNLHRALKVVGERIDSIRRRVQQQERIGAEAIEP